MNMVLTILAGVGVLAFFVWLFIPSPSSDAPSQPGANLDPTDPQHIGMLIGMTGGSITDAAVAQYAIRSFEETHGRKATMQEAGIVVGLMQSGLGSITQSPSLNVNPTN